MILRINLLLRLYQFRAFWQLGAKIKQLTIWLMARLLGVNFRILDEKTNLRALRHLLGITWQSLFFALGIAYLLQIIDPYTHFIFSIIEISDYGNYVTFFATVSGIGGVFIALYFSSITVVGSAIYAKAPNNVRDLLAQEQLGNAYMRFLAVVTFLGLVFIALQVLGLPGTKLAVFIMTILAGVGVIAFVRLGQRAFYLFDPTQLSIGIFEQLRRSIRLVKVGGVLWSEKPFQNYAHQKASSTFDTLETLVDITAKEQHLSGMPFVLLSQHLLQFLMQYEQSKKRIPSNSAWYEQRYLHRDWYRTEDLHVDTAYTTGTLLRPELTTNNEWVEGKVLPILNRCLATNLANKRYSALSGFFDSIDRYVQALARGGEVRKAYELIVDLLSVSVSQLAIEKKNDSENESVLEDVVVVERLTSSSIFVVLSFHEHLTRINLNSIEKGLASIQWDSASDIYRQDLPTYCLERLEWLQFTLKFEKEVEGKLISPLWYRTELICQVVAEHFVDSANAIVFKGAALFRKSIKEAMSMSHSWLLAAILSQEWEYWHKVEHQMNTWVGTWETLTANRRIEGIAWSNFEIDKLRDKIKECKNQLLKLMSRQTTLFAPSSRPEGLPDYGGQFLHTLGETAFDASLNNNFETFIDVFDSYLHGCLLRCEIPNTSDELTEWQKMQEYKVASAPLLDALHISGYVKLLADFYENEVIWNKVVATWDKLFSEDGNPLLIFAIVGAVNVADTFFGLSHRSILHAKWTQKINLKLQNVSRIQPDSRESIFAGPKVDHSSALVRIFARDKYFSLHDGIDLFIEFYLDSVANKFGLEFSPKRRNLRNSIEIEERRNSTRDEFGSE